MQNENFNKMLKNIFNKYSQNSDISDAITNLWLENNLSYDQEIILDFIHEDLEKGTASCSEKYFLILKT